MTNYLNPHTHAHANLMVSCVTSSSATCARSSSLSRATGEFASFQEGMRVDKIFSGTHSENVRKRHDLLRRLFVLNVSQVTLVPSCAIQHLCQGVGDSATSRHLSPHSTNSVYFSLKLPSCVVKINAQFLVRCLEVLCSPGGTITGMASSSP